MITFRQISIENRAYCFFNDMINIRKFDPHLLNIDKIPFRNTDAVIYNIKYITMKSLNHENIDTENPLCLSFNDVDRYIIEESNGCKYLIFASTNNNKKVLRKYTELWDEIKNQIETINGGKPIKYKKDFMKIRFDSNDDLPLGKRLSIPILIIVVKSVFQKDNKYYSQVYMMNVGMNYKKYAILVQYT